MTFKRCLIFTIFVLVGITSWVLADCIQTFELGVGWRRDYLQWKLTNIEESCVCAKASSKIDFKNINMYTLHSSAKWVDAAYYVRLSADYGLSDKGRAKERFSMNDSFFDSCTLSTHVSGPIKRRSEFYDFNGAVGYPFLFHHCRLMAVPLIGLSYHRQRIRVRDEEEDCFCSYFSSESTDSSCGCCSSSSSSCHTCCTLTNPFSCDSPSHIASLFGFSPKRDTSVYRFTWYGVYIGADIAYALDSCWTLFAELEAHFLDRCHRKRKSHTVVSFIDDYHSKGWTYGFNGTVGTTFSMCACWYSTLAVDVKWWRSDVPFHDTLQWKSVGINMSVGYIF